MGWLNTAVAAEGFFLLLHAIDFLSVGPLRLNPLAPSPPTTHTHSMLNPRPDLMETSDFRYTNTENTRQTFSHHPLFLHVNQSFKMTQNYTAKVFTLSNKHWESNQSFHFCYQTAFVSLIVRSVTSATRGRSIKTKERTFAVCCVVGRTYRGYVAAVQLLRAG